MINLTISKILNAVKLPFNNKYRVYTSLVFFLLVASVYLSTVHSQYKVSSKITLNNNANVSLASVVSDLKSKALIQKAVDQLPFAVSYYKQTSPHKEIYGDSLPIKIILNAPAKITYKHELLFKPLSSHSYSIEHEDTIQFYEINEPVNRYYGKFTVTRGPVFRSHFDPVVVRLNEPADLYTSFYNHLNLKTDGGTKTIVLSVLATNVQKGQDFLAKLLALYQSDKNRSALKANNSYNDTLQSLNSKITALRTAVQESKRTSPLPQSERLNTQQLRTLEVIKPYLQNPVKQFIQVPYTDEVKNTALRSDLDRFNKAQLDKQRLLSTQKIDDLTVKSTDKQIRTLQSNILNQIQLLHDGKIENTSRGQTTAEKQLYDAQLKYKELSGAIDLHSSNIIKVVDQVEETSPNVILIYALALLLGILVPFAVTFFSSLNTSVTRINWFNSQTLVEKIKILLGVRQID